MNKQLSKTKKTDEPPEKIHIYYIEGAVPEEAEDRFGSTFIGNWEEDSYSFLFFSAPADEAVNELVKEYPLLNLIDCYDFLYEDWQGETFHELTIGPFGIRPAWLDPSEQKDHQIVIRMDPGVVFGSGIHPTTRDCLRAMAWIWEIDSPRSILDLGTGTGILSIAGVLMGAEGAKAVDLNPLCVRTAQKNIEYNRLDSLIHVVRGKAQDAVGEAADLLIANIHFSVIRELIELKGFRDRKWLILSGLMRSQARDVKDRLMRFGLKVVREWDHDMTWHTMVLRHPDFIVK
jgi:ribosomal protein L11 methyltransferase